MSKIFQILVLGQLTDVGVEVGVLVGVEVGVLVGADVGVWRKRTVPN